MLCGRQPSLKSERLSFDRIETLFLCELQPRLKPERTSLDRIEIFFVLMTTQF